MTVSREVPIICAISSCVRARFTRGSCFCDSPFLRTPLDEELGQLLGGGMREAEGAYFVAGYIVFLAELLGNFEAGFAVLLEEAEEIVALDEIDLAGIDGFGGQFIGLAGDGGAQAENFARLGDLENEGLAVAGADGKFTRPLQSTKMPRGAWPSTKRTAPLG